MLFSTPTQFIVLALVLIAGWFLGLASHPGGRRWKQRYAAERDAHAATRRDSETKLADANRQTVDARRGTDDRLIQANGRIAELESDNARLAEGQRVSKATTFTVTPVAKTEELPGDTPVYVATAARPAYAAGAKRSWFDWG